MSNILISLSLLQKMSPICKTDGIIFVKIFEGQENLVDCHVTYTFAEVFPEKM
jgi:hypothetical protein